MISESRNQANYTTPGEVLNAEERVEIICVLSLIVD